MPAQPLVSRPYCWLQTSQFLLSRCSIVDQIGTPDFLLRLLHPEALMAMSTDLEDVSSHCRARFVSGTATASSSAPSAPSAQSSPAYASASASASATIAFSAVFAPGIRCSSRPCLGEIAQIVQLLVTRCAFFGDGVASLGRQHTANHSLGKIGNVLQLAHETAVSGQEQLTARNERLDGFAHDLEIGTARVCELRRVEKPF